uniref:BCAS3 domain-containing protein n=2 Tax=Plectus sambesii TaxID=2011161 RepID=A0A914W130_9BILA
MSAAVSSMRPAIAQKGQCVKPQPAQEATLVSSVAELVHDVIPQQTPSAPGKEHERVEWISFQSADLNDGRWQKRLKSVTGNAPPVIAVLGLARGYQVWALMGNGDCEELVSDRQGPVKTAIILPSPEASFGIEEDGFANSRPLVAVVDNICTLPERQFCTVGIVSLTRADQVHSLRFDDSVCAVRATTKCLLVIFSNKFIVCDAMTFTQQIVITGCFKTDDSLSGTPTALGHSWLAFADTKLNSVYQSCGGVVAIDSLPSYASQVMSVAKNLGKTMSALGESVVSSLSSSPHSKTVASSTSPGIVTIIDVDRFDKRHNGVHNADDIEGLIAHFAAHIDEAVSFLHFAPGGSLLLSSGLSAQCFHLFSILPHATSSALGAVHHLYTLFRGSTPAKVLSCAFSEDNRWLALATNHGTTHVFPITPYGGSITMRTHGGKVVNRESRYHRTAGLDAIDPQQLGEPSPLTSACGSPISSAGALTSSGSHRSSPLTRDVHPSVNGAHPGLARAVSNPRLPPYPHPLVTQAFAKIRQRFLSPENLSAWASDMTSVSLSATKKALSSGMSAKKGITEYHRVAVVFASGRAWTAGKNESRHSNGLFVGSHDGVLTEYQLKVKPSAVVSGGKVSIDSPIELSVAPVAQWNLSRTKSSPDIRAPLSESNPLLVSARAAQNSQQSKRRSTDCSEESTVSKPWISQVEMVTYGGPHRRLWMGPQFTFRTYLESPGHSSADLVSPSADKRRPFSSPMSMPANSVLRSVPVVIEATSLGNFEQEVDATAHVCGSWSDNDYISCDEQEGRSSPAWMYDEWVYVCESLCNFTLT